MPALDVGERRVNAGSRPDEENVVDVPGVRVGAIAERRDECYPVLIEGFDEWPDPAFLQREERLGQV